MILNLIGTMEKSLDAKPFKESYLPSGVEESADQEVIRYNKIPRRASSGPSDLGIGRNDISVLMSLEHP